MADLTTILNSHRLGPIFDNLTGCLSIRDIIALTRTCRQLASVYSKMVSRGAWDINKRLKKFVKDPYGFRKRLAESDGIISGGFALQFMDRVDWDGSDLDVCVQAGEKADGFVKYIEEVEGYDLASRKVGNYGWTHVDMVHQYDKEVGGEFVRLEIILTIDHPIHATLSTYTTALVNIVTGDHAYCVFPNATFLKRQTFPIRVPDYFNGTILAKKYQDRGWTFIQRTPQEKETTKELDIGRRRIGDRHTWKVVLSAVEGEAASKAEGMVNGLEFETVKREDSTFGLEWLGLTAARKEQ